MSKNYAAKSLVPVNPTGKVKIINQSWGYYLTTQVKSFVPKDKRGQPIRLPDGGIMVVKLLRKFLVLRSRVNGTKTVFKYHRHMGQWKWMIDKAGKDELDVRDHLAMMVRDRTKALELMAKCRNQPGDEAMQNAIQAIEDRAKAKAQNKESK